MAKEKKLSEFPTEYQQRVLERAWEVIGVKTHPSYHDTLLVEWKLALADLTLDEIKKGVEHWKDQVGSCNSDRFKRDCTASLSPVAARELKKMREGLLNEGS